jgi:hypothetical protein
MIAILIKKRHCVMTGTGIQASIFDKSARINGDVSGCQRWIKTAVNNLKTSLPV